MNHKPSIGIRVANTFIYWCHIVLMAAYFVSGFIVGLPWVVFIYLLIQLQLFIFNGCSITKLQHRMGGLPADVDFIPAVAKKVLGKDISHRQHMIISECILMFPLLVALIKTWRS